MEQSTEIFMQNFYHLRSIVLSYLALKSFQINVATLSYNKHKMGYYSTSIYKYSKFYALYRSYRRGKHKSRGIFG